MAGALHESRFSFEAAGRDPQYIQINRDFVCETLNVIPNNLIVDVGSGTGMIARRIRGRYFGVPATIIGIEPDKTAFDIAQREVSSLGATEVTFINDGGEHLGNHVQPNSVDQMFMGNNVHELKRYGVLKSVMHAAAIALKPGGRLAFNTTFVREAMPEARPWGVWKATTAKVLEATRDKSTAGYEYASLDEIVEVAQDTGLQEVRRSEHKVPIQRGMLETIAQYGPFIDGVCGDLLVPEHVVARNPEATYQERLMGRESLALQEAISIMATKQFPENPEMFTLPRIWFTVVMEKPAV